MAVQIWKLIMMLSSVLFNASVAIYNTKTTKIETIEFEGITRDPNHDHSLSGIGFNPVSGLLGVIVHSRAVFVTDGADISHDHFSSNTIWTQSKKSPGSIYPKSRSIATQGSRISNTRP